MALNSAASIFSIDDMIRSAADLFDSPSQVQGEYAAGIVQTIINLVGTDTDVAQTLVLMLLEREVELQQVKQDLNNLKKTGVLA